MNKTNITLKDRKMICENCLAIWFDYSKTKFRFEPGQYAKITLLDTIHDDSEGNSRLFSIASSPTNKDTLMFTTRDFNTAFNKNIKELPLGSKATIGEPGGNTVLHKDIYTPAVFIVGGIGITPVRCMVEYAITSNLPYEMQLFYSNPKSASMAFLAEFERWEEMNPNFRLHPTIDDADDPKWEYDFGYIDEEMLKRYIKDFSKPIYYLIGPTVMVDKMNEILLNNGVKSENIKLERFG